MAYDGAWDGGIRKGTGVEYWPGEGQKRQFEGEFLNDERHGHGREYGADGAKVIFEGQFQSDEKHGHGREYQSDGVPAIVGGPCRGDA